MAAPLRAGKGFFGFGEPVVCHEQHRELERGIGDTALVGSAVGRRGAGDLAAFFEQHCEVVSSGPVAALVGAGQPLFGFGDPVLAGEQHPQFERSLDIPALVGAVIGRRGLGDFAALFEQLTQVVGGGGVAAPVSTGKRAFGFSEQVLFGQQDGELERAVRVASVVGATVCGGGAGEIAALLEQHAEVMSRDRVAALVRTRQPFFGFGQPVLIGE
jgi:hypothetical protein